MAKATATKPPQKVAVAKDKAPKAKAKGNGAAKPEAVTPKATNGEKAEPQVCKTCGRPFVSEERSSAAKRAWDTIRANREAGFKTTAERLAAVQAQEAAKAPKAKAVKPNGNGKATEKSAKSKKKAAKA
jgi:hypothetical protein